ncbi:MAG: Rrf2 family transcriptional regulator [Oscillospiraceae bacterium]|nr:Rrf2 family transcriptional regulator [Oscillospiraceae bacterium]
MLISTRGRYALQILIDIAEHQSDGYIPLKDVAERRNISEKYMEAIVKLLVKDGILESLRGKGGGYRLNGSPDRFTTGRVLRLTEESLAPVSCLATNCAKMSECRTINFWKGLDDVITNYLESFTIADLMQQGEPGNDYII